jgi:hypothetical protein
MLGATPAFGGFYVRLDVSSGSFHAGHNTRRKPEGWAIKVLWVLEPGTSDPVTISGHDVDTGAPIAFDPSNGSVSDTMLLDPSNPGTPDRRKGWTAYPSELLLPEAGCYQIEASWTDGSWQRGFGFGR